MKYWIRRNTTLVSIFSVKRIRHLREHVDAYLAMLSDAASWQSLHGSGCLPANASDLAVAHMRAMSIIAQRTRREVAADSRREEAYLEHMIENAHVVLTTMRSSGPSIILSHADDVKAWIWTLYECCMDMALVHELPWAMEPRDIRTDLRGHRRLSDRRDSLVAWILEIVDDLLETVDFSVWLAEGVPDLD